MLPKRWRVNPAPAIARAMIDAARSRTSRCVQVIQILFDDHRLMIIRADAADQRQFDREAHRIDAERQA